MFIYLFIRLVCIFVGLTDLVRRGAFTLVDEIPRWFLFLSPLPSFFAKSWQLCNNQSSLPIMTLTISRVECPRNVNRLKKNMTCGKMTCEMNNLEVE